MFKTFSDRLNSIISDFNNARTNKDLKKWTIIKQDIINLKIDIQTTVKISIYHLQQILTKTRQTQDRIARTIAQISKSAQVDCDSNRLQQPITIYLLKDPNNPFDTND